LESKTIVRFGLIGLSIVLGIVVRTGVLDPIEAPYIGALQQAVLSANLMWFFQAFTHLGDSSVDRVRALAPVLRLWKARMPLKLILFITVVAGVVVVYRLIFQRLRPFDEFAGKIQDAAFEGLPSCPSGHVAPAACGFYLLANHSARLNAVFGLLVALLGLSRVITGAHYFTDVIGSALLSYPIALIIDDMKVFERFKSARDRPKWRRSPRNPFALRRQLPSSKRHMPCQAIV
jgi:membrane-associated phospholipid phosphatase